MTTVYLIRHGEAEGNIYRRAQGFYNSNLTKHGLSQVARLAERFKDIPVDCVYSSDLKRAYQTVKAIADTKGLTVTKSEKLREINMGTMEDKPWGDMPRLHKELNDNWTNDPHKCKFEDGESPVEARDRFFEEFMSIVNQNEGKNIVIGAHGAVIRYFLYRAKDICVREKDAISWCDNTAVAKLVINNGKIDVEFMNDSSHIEDMKTPFSQKRWWEMSEEEMQTGLNLWFRPVDLEKEFDILCEFMLDFYKIAYNDISKFNKDEFLIECKKSQEISPESVSFGMLSDNIAGISRIDLLISNENIGFIGNIALSEQYRGSIYAPQIIGHFVSQYRNLGKDTLRARVSKDNPRAIKFYEKIGFVQNGELKNQNGDHFLMDLDLNV